MAKTIHGATGTKEFDTWRAMKQRCCGPTYHSYAAYGGRGIKVCMRWLRSFPNFLADVGYAPSPDHSIDRIDNAKGYEPGNCRWATITEQNRNKGNVRSITAFGETKLLADWARDSRCSITPEGLAYRLDHGWKPEAAISRPAIKGRISKQTKQECTL